MSLSCPDELEPRDRSGWRAPESARLRSDEESPFVDEPERPLEAGRLAVEEEEAVAGEGEAEIFDEERGPSFGG